MNDQPVVVTRELTKKYGDFVALDSLSIELHRGRILGFIGPNGAGKTTTIRILVGLAEPTSGSASIAGCDCTTEMSRIKRLVGYMPDTFGAYENMRVREYLDFFGAAYRIPRRVRLERIEQVMELCSATWMKDRYVEALSHGMKQRIGLCRTMLHDPEVLILDEPANGLDPNARIEMRQILLRLAEAGKTLIVTSHILPELSRICDTVAIVTRGRLRAFGTLDQIMKSLRQRRMMQVQLHRREDVDSLVRLLKENLEEDAEVNPSPQELEVRFSTALDDARLAAILALVVHKGIEVIQYGEVPLDLEDAFLSVTRAEAEEDAAAAAGTPAAGEKAEESRA